MKYIVASLLLLLLAFSVCYASICKDTAIDCREVVKAFGDLIDEKECIEIAAKKCQVSKDSLNRIISDNITVETIQKTQELYNTSFSNIQSSFNIFIVAVGVIITALTLISTILNIKIVNDSKKEVKEELAKTKDFENKLNGFEKQMKESTASQNSEFDNMKNKFNEKIKELKIQRNRDFATNHHFYQTTLDKETISILTEFENELGEKKIIPYLEEFYKRLVHSQYFDLWNKLTTEQKKDGFRKIIEQVDSIWGEKLFPDEEN